MKRCWLILLGLAGGVGLVLTASGKDAAAMFGRDTFVYEQAGHRVKVWCYVPRGAEAEAPVVFVMHGIGRNPEDYLNDWAPYAEQRRFILVVPEFSRAEFPGAEGYLYGNTVDRAGRPVAHEQWAFSMIEPIFDAVRARAGSHRPDYLLYGFSAGAQFVQRFLYFVPEARVAHAVAADAGWYMLPDLTAPFPYGLKNTVVGEAPLRAALARRLTILLGEADTDPNAALLRHTPEAEAQGAHRFARGQYFHRSARAAADALKVPCGWSLSTAPGVAHSETGMTPFAVQCLLPDLLSPKNPETPHEPSN